MEEHVTYDKCRKNAKGIVNHKTSPDQHHNVTRSTRVLKQYNVDKETASMLAAVLLIIDNHFDHGLIGHPYPPITISVDRWSRRGHPGYTKLP
jgi:hypothetical protein